MSGCQMAVTLEDFFEILVMISPAYRMNNTVYEYNSKNVGKKQQVISCCRRIVCERTKTVVYNEGIELSEAKVTPGRTLFMNIYVYISLVPTTKDDPSIMNHLPSTSTSSTSFTESAAA